MGKEVGFLAQVKTNSTIPQPDPRVSTLSYNIQNFGNLSSFLQYKVNLFAIYLNEDIY